MQNQTSTLKKLSYTWVGIHLEEIYCCGLNSKKYQAWEMLDSSFRMWMMVNDKNAFHHWQGLTEIMVEELHQLCYVPSDDLSMICLII